MGKPPPKKFTETGRSREEVMATPEYKQRAKAALEHARHPEVEMENRVLAAPFGKEIVVKPGEDLHTVVGKMMTGELTITGRTPNKTPEQQTIRRPKTDVVAHTARTILAITDKMLSLSVDAPSVVVVLPAKIADKKLSNVKMKDMTKPADEMVLALPPIQLSGEMNLPCEFCGKPVNYAKGIPHVLEYGKKAPGLPDFLGLPWKRVAHSACMPSTTKGKR